MIPVWPAQKSAKESIVRSRARRERVRRHRTITRLLSLPAVVGVGLLVAFVTYPIPYIEVPYLFVGGILLVLPFLVFLLEKVD